MNYIKITPLDVANGPGCRVVLWTAGCSHHCKECHNPDTWDPCVGQPFDDNAMQELLETMSKPYVDGITLSGGDPFYTGNRDKIGEICKVLKERFPNKTIWCYTGYVYDQVKDLEAMKYIDVLVDGPFIIEKKNLMLLFRGSENQRLIDMNKTRESGAVILFEKPE